MVPAAVVIGAIVTNNMRRALYYVRLFTVNMKNIGLPVNVVQETV